MKTGILAMPVFISGTPGFSERADPDQCADHGTDGGRNCFSIVPAESAPDDRSSLCASDLTLVIIVIMYLRPSSPAPVVGNV